MRRKLNNIQVSQKIAKQILFSIGYLSHNHNPLIKLKILDVSVELKSGFTLIILKLMETF